MDHFGSLEENSLSETSFYIIPDIEITHNETKIYRPINLFQSKKPNACINSISGKPFKTNGVQDVYDGETLNVYPNFVEFRPWELNMNCSLKEFTGFIPFEDKKLSLQEKKVSMHYEYKKNRYGIENVRRHEFFNCTFGEHYVPSAREYRPYQLRKAQFAYQLSSENPFYTRQSKSGSTERSKRGLITCISPKSANRLKKTMSRVLNLDLWIDLTFSDDVFEGMNFQEKLKFSYDRLNEFERFIRSLGIHYIWKKEIKPRLSGRLLGERVPHYHVALCYLSEDQKRNYKRLCIQLLKKWVSITGTTNPDAWKVALNKDRFGEPSSYRLIKSAKMAGCYIGKYFSKTEPLKDYPIESIGRAWGKSLGIPLADAIQVNLTRNESIRFRRIVRKALKLRKNKKFIGCNEQLKRGYSTFLFLTEDFIFRLAGFVSDNPFKKADPVPF